MLLMLQDSETGALTAGRTSAYIQRALLPIINLLPMPSMLVGIKLGSQGSLNTSATDG